MPLLIAGIDEAGYGPRLGPLCVGLGVFRVEHWEAGQPAPDLWSLLKGGVCRGARDTKGRVAIADSKELKRPNTAARPLALLERGIRAMLATIDRRIEHDAALFETLGVCVPDEPWYAEHQPRNLEEDAGAIGIAGNGIGRAMEASGVSLVDLRAIAMGEARFNELVHNEGTKARATAECIGMHLSRVVELAIAQQGEVRVVCDRLGGRMRYSEELARLVPQARGRVRVIEERDERSRYGLTVDGLDREMFVQFEVEGEEAHMPIALASMAAKFVRELMMRRFNAYWQTHVADLKPTAGYGTDSNRWLKDAGRVVTPELRRRLVRRA